MKEIIDRLIRERSLSLSEYEALITCDDGDAREYLRQCAGKTRDRIYGKEVFIRGLIEISSCCANDCRYCGIRSGNIRAERYRLNKEDILNCAAVGYNLGFRTFVLQGGEDPYYKDSVLIPIVEALKGTFPDCALTLSLGERSLESYRALKEAGADRYLLRHETADREHYGKLHPSSMSFDNRMECLRNLKELGYQTGCGFMVGSPCQTPRTLAKDLKFIEEFKPHMCGIGPFIPHKDTPFGGEIAGSVELTIHLLSVIRLIHPRVLLPATTALGTLDESGRERAVLAGANVVMPNLSPGSVRSKYLLYDNKLSDGDEAAESVENLKKKFEKIGYKITPNKGDFIPE